MILPEYYDERNDWKKLFWRTLFFKKRFYRFNYKKNWHFVDIDRPDLIDFMGNLTDCIFILDEGQDIFSSTGRIAVQARKVITRTRHMHKTLIIISQRANAVDVNFRNNCQFYYKCVNTRAFYWPFKPYFKIYRTEEMDKESFPVWESNVGTKAEWHAAVWHSHFASNRIFNAYNSWYLRGGVPRSQEVYFEAYELSTWEKIKAFFRKKPKVEQTGYLGWDKTPLPVPLPPKKRVKKQKVVKLLVKDLDTHDERQEFFRALETENSFPGKQKWEKLPVKA